MSAGHAQAGESLEVLLIFRDNPGLLLLVHLEGQKTKKNNQQLHIVVNDDAQVFVCFWRNAVIRIRGSKVSSIKYRDSGEIVVI